jgi:hypothetical protein
MLSRVCTCICIAIEIGERPSSFTRDTNWAMPTSAIRRRGADNTRPNIGEEKATFHGKDHAMCSIIRSELAKMLFKFTRTVSSDRPNWDSRPHDRIAKRFLEL